MSAVILALVGSLLTTTPAQAVNSTGSGGVFVPSTGRVLDTKNGTGGYSTAMEAGKYRTVQVAGLAGVPDDGSVGAISINATIGSASTTGTLFARPDADTSRTMVAIYNNHSGEYTSNTGVVALGDDGTIQVMTESASRLIIDVQGYYTTNDDGTAPGGFVPLAGKRIVDTRSGLGAPQATLTPGSSIDVQVGGVNGVPADASAAVVNLVPISTSSSDGFLVPYPTDGQRPANSLHYAPTSTTSIQAQVALSADGKMTVLNPSGTANLAIDLQGYFTAPGSGGAVFTPGTGRVYDSRSADNTILAKNETRSIQVAGKSGVPVMGSGISAVVITLTASHPGSDGRASVWADGTEKPDTTSISFRADEMRTNTVTVPLGTNGKITLNNVAAPTDYLIDVQGWYVNTVGPAISCPFAADSRSSAIPTAPINCTVSNPPADGNATNAEILIDGVSAWTGALSKTGFQTQPAVLTARGGFRSVTAVTYNDAGGVVSSSDYNFAIGGNWDQEQLTAFPANGANASTTTDLGARIENDDWPEDTQFKYTLSTHTDPAIDPIETTDWTGSDYTVPAGLLTAGEKYFWSVAVSGTPTGASETTTKELPTQSFIASSAAIEPECTTALSRNAQAEGYNVQASDWATYCPAVVTADSDNSAAASLTSAVTRASGTIRSQNWSQDSAADPVWSIQHKGKVYYDGKKAWIKKYRGKTGYHLCGSDGYAHGVSVDVSTCGNRQKSNGTEVLWMTHTVKANGPYGTSFTWWYTVHRSFNKGGVSFTGRGTGL